MHLLYMVAPIIKSWEIFATQDMTIMNVLGSEFLERHDVSGLKIELKDLKFAINTEFTVDRFGYLDPRVYSCEFDFGESSVQHNHEFFAFIIDQLLHLGIVVMERSCNAMGEYMFKTSGGPVLDNLLNHYSW